jgi:hypothetical protein
MGSMFVKEEEMMIVELAPFGTNASLVGTKYRLTPAA